MLNKAAIYIGFIIKMRHKCVEDALSSICGSKYFSTKIAVHYESWIRGKVISDIKKGCLNSSLLYRIQDSINNPFRPFLLEALKASVIPFLSSRTQQLLL